MRNLSIDDEDFLDAAFDGVGASVDFGDHAACDGAVFLEGFRLFDGEGLDEAAGVVLVLEDAVDVAHEDETFGVQGSCDFSGCCVGVDIVRLSFVVDADGGNDGDVAACEEVVDDAFIDGVDFSYKAEGRVLGVDVNEVAVYTAEAGCLSAKGGEFSDKAFIDLTGKDHLHDFHGVFVRDSEAVHEVGLDVEGIQHMVDIRAASMDEDDIDADEAEEKDVLHDGFLQFRIGHCISAVLGNDVFSCVFFDVRDRLGEDLGAYCISCLVHGKSPFRGIKRAPSLWKEPLLLRGQGRSLPGSRA